MNRYILEYHKAKYKLEKSNILEKTYWRKRVIFLHRIIKENGGLKELKKSHNSIDFSRIS